MKTFKTALSLIMLMATWLRVSLKRLTFIGVFISISSSALANQKVTLLLDWFVNPDHGPIIIAKEKGFFSDRGLEVDIIAPADPADPPKLVAAGKADLAISYQPQLHLQVAEGMPLTRVGTLVATPLNCLLVLANGPIKNISDLKGKKVGFSVAGVEEVLLKTILERNGVKLSDIDLVNVTTKQFYLLQSETNYFVKADQLIHDTYNEIYSSGRVQICAYLLMAVYCLGSSNSYQPIIQSLIESASYNQNKSLPAILDPEFITTIDGTMLQPIAKKLELYLAIPNNKLIQCIKDYQRNQQVKSINRIIDLLFNDYAVFSITKLRLTINWFAVSAQYMHIMLNPGLINNVK